MATNIHTIPLGFDQAYLIQEKGTIMIDGGEQKKTEEFKEALEELSIKPEEIRLMVMTHGHFDHIGSAKEIKELTGAKIAIHHTEKDWLEQGQKIMPPAVGIWGSIMWAISSAVKPFYVVPGTPVDVVIGDEGLSLEEYVSPARWYTLPVIPPGSVSVLLDTGEAFVGDMAMSRLPLRRKPGLPIFAEDLSAVKESWKMFLEHGVKTVYPAHGESFSADIMREAIA